MRRRAWPKRLKRAGLYGRGGSRNAGQARSKVLRLGGPQPGRLGLGMGLPGVRRQAFTRVNYTIL